MAKYPLAALLEARKFREEAALREERLAREAAERAYEAAERARAEFLRYRERRPEEERRLFEQVRGKELSQADLDRHLEDVRRLRQMELQKEEASAQAARMAESARETAEKTRRLRVEAFRERQKIEEHKGIWLKKESRRLEAANESEAEDAAAGRKSGDGMPEEEMQE